MTTLSGRYRWLALAWIAVLLVGAWLVAVGHGRNLFNYDTETDYVATFVAEAERLSRGEALEVAFHPPVYAVALAFGRAFHGDWLTVGVFLSIASALASMVLALVLLRRLLGTAAAIGGVIAFAVSPTFLAYATQATSDVFALALYLWAVLAAHASAERGGVGRHLSAGVAIGIGFLARTNHVVLIGLLLFHLLGTRRPTVPRPMSATLRAMGFVLVGLSLPIAAWFGWSRATGSPFLPTQTYENFALTYFAEGDRITGDARLEAAAAFSSTWEVLVADPGRVARIYVQDLARTSYALLARDTVLPFPFMVLSVVGWMAALRWQRERWRELMALLLNLLAMVLLINFKAYEPRYYLFLVPFVGGAVGCLASRLLLALERPALRGATVAGFVVVAAWLSVVGAGEALRLRDRHLAVDAWAAAQAIADLGPVADGVVVARKPHVGFYADLERAEFPLVHDMDELMAALAKDVPEEGGRRWLLYGSVERGRRAGLTALADPGAAAGHGLWWVASGDEAGGWLLYEVLDDWPAKSATSPAEE